MAPPLSPDAPTAARWSRAMLCCGALLGLLTVAMGAVAAHLPDRLLAPGGRALLRSAVEMQGWHIPALLVCGLLADRPALRVAGAGFLAGLGCFCAGLYTLAFGIGGTGGIARLAPVGGTILMAAWLMLAICCATRRRG
jgi:uncharacterized membrane protein YgdD (TMEM256/DUF423 family)